jgi:tRNA-dihydrouridine synthase B
MAGVSDYPFRTLCRSLGAAMTVAEMLTADTRLWHTRKSRLRMLQNRDPEPRAIQIAGTNARQMAEAARLCADQGAQIIDINMGCPAKKVCNVLAGSALLRNERLAGEILSAVVNAVSVPVSLKIRTGWDRDNRNALTIAHIAEDAGIQALAIHGRTRTDRFNGFAEYETMREVKERIKIPVFANGDIDSPAKAKAVLDYTRADGLLIARASQGNPWIFREINYYLDTGKILPAPTVKEKRAIILRHLHAIYNFYGAESGVRIARKHLNWFFMPGYPLFWQDIRRLETPEEQYVAVNHFMQKLQEHRGNSECISNQNRLAA